VDALESQGATAPQLVYAVALDLLSLLIHHDQLKCILRNLEVIESRSKAIKLSECFGSSIE
jgi:hypothetical protein